MEIKRLNAWNAKIPLEVKSISNHSQNRTVPCEEIKYTSRDMNMHITQATDV
ncbi:hypothetical protein [Flavobacterium limi]|uniref:hypothetical protein n=1 Tax=Flavobacterium limi TaxID=2045105 RepID=UPI0013D38B2E|nr:hypothetical protein [Flavobacterium limi]